MFDKIIKKIELITKLFLFHFIRYFFKENLIFGGTSKSLWQFNNHITKPIVIGPHKWLNVILFRYYNRQYFIECFVEFS